MSANSVSKHNKETEQWEVVAASDASLISTSVPDVLVPGEVMTTVDRALSRTNQKIEKLQQNVSWLAAHGGGGGGGGGEFTSSVTLTNGNITTSEGINILYSTAKEVKLDYLISALKNNQKFTLNVSLDGNNIVTGQEAWSGTPGSIIIKNISQYSSSNSHSVVVTATDSEGINATPYMLTIIESSINLSSSVASVTATIGLAYNITYTITNKVLAADTSLIVNNITNGVSKTFELGKFATTEPLLYDVDFFGLFIGTPAAGSSYTIEAFAQTSIDGNTIISETVTNKVVVEDGTSLVVLVDGITTKAEVAAGTQPSQFPQGGNISFSFTPYLAGVSIIYYAVRLQKGNIVRDIGYFNPTSDHPFNENQYVQRGKQQIFSWSVAQNDDYLGDWDITLRCWSEKGTPITDTELACTVVKSAQSLIADQNPRNTRYASWSIKSDTFPITSTASLWTSEELNYIPPGTTEAISVYTPLNVYNTNGELSGFLSEKGQNKLRLSGESYGIVDLQPFKDNISENSNWSKLGFTFSVTIKTDLHPFADRTVFFIGDYSSDGSFSEGIKVSLEDIIWSYTDGNIKETISCKLHQNTVNTIDFIVDKNNSEVKIFINGILNAAREIKTDFTWRSNSKFYLACDADSNGIIGNFSDIEVYDMRFFRSALNDKQIVINALNARANSSLMSDGTVDFSLYNTWKAKNFFSTSEATSSSTLWDDQNNTYANINFDALISDSNKKPPLPVVYIDCGGSGFTKAVYEAVGANPTEYTGCTFNYYDPNSAKSSAVSTGELSVQIQGTSSTGYRSKNLEIMFRKELRDDNGGLIGPELFQPNNTWMPESQFTLKADVVDSAHANNASIGKWINDNSDLLFDKTPPMEQLEARRPVDTRDKAVTHKDVTIKHTLEGFPCILLIKFDGTDTQEMLGIYSFNLGRNAYFNMGFKFFKSFSRRIKDSFGVYQETPVPAFITTYETYNSNEKFGTIDQRQIYSYEFSENANVIMNEDGTRQMTALFMQDDLSILQHVGEFRYNGANGDNSEVSDNNVWQRLQLLFTDLASMTGEAVDKYRWNTQTKGYEKTGAQYAAQQSWSALADDLTNRLNIRNAYSYFVVCIAFGLVDSLGKNMTIRSWNVGGATTDENMNKWWPCFYDMDTAFGLSNTGEENVPKTAYLDTFANANVASGVNSLVITANSADGGYDTYSSRLWDVLRDTRFINTGVYSGAGYNALWETWRSVGTLLKEANYYVDNYFSIQMRNCGELLYNYDYKVKYLTRYSKDEGSSASYANIEFLHGPRIEYVRDWLKKRYYFMDGVFQYSNSALIQPYNEKGAFKCGGTEGTSPVLTVRTNCPLIFTVNIGQTSAGDIRYFVDENTPTNITLSSVSSFNTQITINGISQINQLDGLKNMRFQGFMSTLTLPSFSNVDMSGVNTLSSSPILFETAFINDRGFSDVRHIDLSNTSFWVGNGGVSTFTVNIEKYTKLKDIDISNSVVTSMSLPNASLASLNITNSNIEMISLVNQPFLSNVDFNGCKKLKSVNIDSCDKITALDLSNLGDLSSLTITNCPNLTSIVCNNNPNLTTFNVSNCNHVESINLYQCTNAGLNIYIVGAPNITSLNVSNTNTANPIQAASSLLSLKTLDIRNTNLSAIQYGSEVIPTYKNVQIFDISRLNLNTFSATSAKGIHYLKVNNSKTKPFAVGTSAFTGCTNLKRVFGHIKLNGSNAFNQCSQFYIHEPPAKVNNRTPMYDGSWYGPDTDTSAGKTSWDAGTDLATNMTIGSASLSGTFTGTKCGIFDIYYVLYKCDNVTNINSLFSSCTNAKWDLIDSPNRNMFSHCTKVTSATSLFWGCPSQEIIMYGSQYGDDKATLHNGLLSPLVSLVNCDSMFYFSGTIYTDEFFLSKFKGGVDSKISALHYFNSGSIKFISNASERTKDTIDANELVPADCGRLLSKLPALVRIVETFRGSNINFTQVKDTDDTVDDIRYCPLFYYNTKLQYIQNSFNNLSGSTGSLLNVFGGQVKNKRDKFPNALYGIYNSFVNVPNVVFPLHNSMFSRLRGSLKYITSSSATNGSTLGSFQMTKTFVQEDDEVFPYDIFTGCTALIEIPGFFNGFKPSTLIEAELPGESFKTNTNLTNISYLYYGMSNVKYRLTGKGFTNCKLVNVARCFDETVNTFSKKGQIPYGLFYQSYRTGFAYKGWNVTDAASSGITEKFGIDAEGNWIPDDKLPTALPAEKTYNITKSMKRKTINNMSYALNNFQSNEAQPYTMDYGSLTIDDYGDMIVPNEAYNPVKYVVNPNYDPREYLDEENTIINYNRDIRRVIPNTAYDGYEYIWNKYCLDGSSGVSDIVLNSPLYTSVQNKEINISPNLPEEFSDEANEINAPTSVHANQQVMKYLCAPDLFLYCTNSTNMVVNGVFNNGGRPNGNSEFNYLDWGIRGRICPFLFEPIPNATDLSYMFYLCVLVNPYKWNNAATGDEGQMYSPKMFAYVPKLISISNMFYFGIIPANVVIPVDTFINNLNLQDISNTWRAVQFNSTAAQAQQLQANTFSRNTNLRNISSAFASGTSNGDWTGRGPKKIDSTLFTAAKHKNINNCSYIFGNNNTTTGSVPEFWTWLGSLPAASRAEPFRRMQKANIANSANIPSTWSIGME